MICTKSICVTLRIHLRVLLYKWKGISDLKQETEIHILEKGLRFLPTPSRITESHLMKDINEFAQKIIFNKTYFQNVK